MEAEIHQDKKLDMVTKHDKMKSTHKENKMTAVKKDDNLKNNEKKLTIVTPTQHMKMLQKEAKPLPSSSSKAARAVKEEDAEQGADDDAIPEWAAQWGKEINGQVSKDLNTMLRAVKEQEKNQPKGGHTVKTQRRGWSNKCAALIQAYKDGEWWKCNQLVERQLVLFRFFASISKYHFLFQLWTSIPKQTIVSILGRTQNNSDYTVHCKPFTQAATKTWKELLMYHVEYIEAAAHKY